jgi:hypothetical protein
MRRAKAAYHFLHSIARDEAESVSRKSAVLPTYRMILTGLVWPMRCARAAAWRSFYSKDHLVQYKHMRPNLRIKITVDENNSVSAVKIEARPAGFGAGT